jgi:hypothetical protein
MTRATFHWREIKNSNPLQFLLGILMDASGPMTQMDIQLEAQRRGGWVANPPTSIGEIGQNQGYRVSDGVAFGQKPGPAVRFPDGKYRYWLVSAPGWRQRWTVDREFRVVSAGGGPAAEGAETPREEAPAAATGPRRCENPVCGREIPAEGPPWCPGSEVCQREFFKGLQRKLF